MANYFVAGPGITRMLKGRGIDLHPVFFPLSSQPVYSAFASAREAQGRNVVSYRISPYGSNLSSEMNITSESVNDVCYAVKKVLAIE